jgi:hypothetical protein
MFDGKLVEVKTTLGSSFSNPKVVAVPFLLWYSSTDVVSENGIRNDQLAICDTNGDNVISLDEATIYAAKVDEQVAKHNAEKAKIDAQIANGPNSTTAPSYTPPPPTYPAQPASAQEPLEARQPKAPLPPGGYR